MILLSTGSLYTFGLSRVFGLAAEAGYEGIEIIVDQRQDTRDPTYLRRLSDEHHLPIAVLHTPFVPDIPGWPADQLGRLKHTLALARELGVGLVVAHLPFRIHGIVGHWYGLRPRRFILPIFWPLRGPYYHLLRDGALQQLEETFGVVVAVENMPAHRFLGIPISAYWFNRPDHLTRFLHLTLDTTHLGTWGMDPVEVYGRLKDRITHVHLSNYDGKEHRLPFDGSLPLAQLLRRMGEDGYQGTISVETDPSAMDTTDEGKILEALRQALEFCRSHLSSSTVWR
ncbi:MAG TPA: sugar phosphate isomerase/epimerase [Thermoflexia bacterium]|nr:sugar phosphate isomerase/epimerase [Thermoflexia bacterium]